MLSGVLERSPREKPEAAPAEPEAAAEASSKGRGVGPAPRPSKVPASRAARRIKGRTLYIPDDLWERMIVQAHRRNLTISDYSCLLLDRHVPDHRIVRAGGSAATPADPGDDQDAA